MKTCAPVVLALALAFGGCSAGPAQVVTVTASPPASQSTPTPTDPDTIEPSPEATEPATNERGNVMKKVGEKAMLVTSDGEPIVTFTVTKIETGFKCNSGIAEKSENGQFVGIWMDITTTKLVNSDSDSDDTVPYFNPSDWKVIGSDGTEENDSSGSASYCAEDSISLPSQIKGAKHVKGVWVVDTKYKRGSLALVQDYHDTGWEWSFPQP